MEKHWKFLHHIKIAYNLMVCHGRDPRSLFSFEKRTGIALIQKRIKWWQSYAIKEMVHHRNLMVLNQNSDRIEFI